MQNYDIDQVLFLMRPQAWFAQEKMDAQGENVTCIDDWLEYSSEHPESSEIDDDCYSSNSVFMNLDKSASNFEDGAFYSSKSSVENLGTQKSKTIYLESADFMTAENFRHSLSLSSPIFVHERGGESWRDLL